MANANQRKQEVGDGVDGINDVTGPAAVVQQQPADEQGEAAVCEHLNDVGRHVEAERWQYTADDVTDDDWRKQYGRCAQVIHTYQLSL